ncbi:MAG: PLDc N-terminal domain-containing protein [Candidatus Dormibacteraeota bacterium]|nr:PLDc N-terminal domain-containing protein [Candidatus Dormibacteraeota bacterium]
MLIALAVTVIPWVYGIIDVLRAPDLTGDTRIVWMLALTFAWPVGIIAWLVLRGRPRWRHVVIAVLVAMMSMILIVTIVEAVNGPQPHAVVQPEPAASLPLPTA